ncbi:MAG TPA: glutamate 5-kinase [Pseudomonadales bacterium]
MSRRDVIRNARRVVVKIGSALLTNDGRGLDRPAIAGWVAQLAGLREQGLDVLLVSSGAVAEGMTRLGWKQRPVLLHELQAAAAVGQMGLVHNYEAEFQRYGFHTAQVLLVHEDLSDRRRYLNARNTLQTLLRLGVVPVVNENDTIATDEIRFGDNDTLAAIVANVVDADLLVILTDQLAMYDADPRNNADARPIREMRAGSPELRAMAGDGGVLGRGGMITKVRAAELAARSGTATVIVGGRIDSVLPRLRQGEELGTLLYSEQKPLEARKLWLAGLHRGKGVLEIDDGAAAALRRGGASLLAVGVRSVAGHFAVGDTVVCRDKNGNDIAKGLVNYHSDDVAQIIGQPSQRFLAILGYQGEAELIHCDNMVIL